MYRRQGRTSFGSSVELRGFDERVPFFTTEGPCMNDNMSNHARAQAHPNNETAKHKFPVGTYVYHTASLLAGREIFKITRLLPESGAGFQYRIKGEREGFERVATESSLEAID
jgi:hypothetical protein